MPPKPLSSDRTHQQELQKLQQQQELLRQQQQHQQQLEQQWQYTMQHQPLPQQSHPLPVSTDCGILESVLEGCASLCHPMIALASSADVVCRRYHLTHITVIRARDEQGRSGNRICRIAWVAQLPHPPELDHARLACLLYHGENRGMPVLQSLTKKVGQSVPGTTEMLKEVPLTGNSFSNS